MDRNRKAQVFNEKFIILFYLTKYSHISLEEMHAR